MTPPWSPTLALSMLLRACAAEALTPREGESDDARYRRVCRAAANIGHPVKEWSARMWLSDYLCLPPDVVDRYIAEVYASPAPMTEDGRREALGRAIAAEREACAQVAEQVDGAMMGTGHDACTRIAQGIRGRTWLLY